jgi:hypothetical protein
LRDSEEKSTMREEEEFKERERERERYEEYC